MAETISSNTLTASYTGHPSILQIPHICLYKLIVLLPCQVDFAAIGKENAVIVIPHYVRHIYQIPPVATVKAAPKLSFQFLHRGIRLYDLLHVRGMDFHFLPPVFNIQDAA